MVLQASEKKELPGGELYSYGHNSNEEYYNRKFSASEEIKTLRPRKQERIPVAPVIAADIIVPGGGHFYRDDYFYGGVFASLKIISYFSIYYYYKEWSDERSAYNKAKREAVDSGTVSRKNYEQATQHLLFSIAGNIIISGISIAVNIHELNKINKKAVPTFDYSLRDAGCGGQEGYLSFRFSKGI